jgi:DNA-binding NarL/FixJ family response regulator
MYRRRILVLSRQTLLGESLERILGEIEDVEVIGSWLLDDSALPELPNPSPDLLLIADDEVNAGGMTGLALHFMELYPNLPVIRVELDRNILQVFTSQMLPARVADLIDAIRRLPVSDLATGDDSLETPMRRE